MVNKRVLGEFIGSSSCCLKGVDAGGGSRCLVALVAFIALVALVALDALDALDALVALVAPVALVAWVVVFSCFVLGCQQSTRGCMPLSKCSAWRRLSFSSL